MIQAVSKIVSALVRNAGKGKFVGQSKNGVKVFQKTTKNGQVVTTSYKNGKLYKTITKNQIVKNEPNTWVPNSSTGHKTVVVNHETGVKTTINKELVDYKIPFGQFNTTFKAGVRKEFSVYRTQNIGEVETYVGNAYTRVEAPNFLGQTKTRYLSNESYISKSTWNNGFSTDKYITTKNFEMPNGNTVTGEWGRNYWNNGEHSSNLMLGSIGSCRKSPLVMTPQGNGTYHITR